MLLATTSLGACGGANAGAPITTRVSPDAAEESAGGANRERDNDAGTSTSSDAGTLSTPNDSPPARAHDAGTKAALLPVTDKTKRWQLVVSFTSECCGTDGDALDRLDAIIASLPAAPLRARGYWGKEGEHDDCFDLAPLPAAERERFVARVQKEVVGRRVSVARNATCRSR